MRTALLCARSLVLSAFVAAACGRAAEEPTPIADAPADRDAPAVQPEAPAPDAKPGKSLEATHRASSPPRDDVHHEQCREGGCAQACEPKPRCRLSCRGGDCKQICRGDLCSAGCTEGRCEQTCDPGVKTCRLSCPGGRCTQTCKAGSECQLSCRGGECTQTCEPGSTCTLECAAGKCTQACDGATQCTKG